MRSDYLAGVTVTVRENDRELREYEAESPQGAYKTTTAYIESVPGAEFTVDIIFDDAYPYQENDFTAYLSLDGNEMIGRMCRKNQFSHKTIIFKGAIGGTSKNPTIQRFTFAALTTTDAQPKASLKDKIAKLGDIDVKLYRCRLGAMADYNYDIRAEESVAAGGVPEKSLKGRAVSTHATLGKSEPTGAQAHVDVHYDFGKVPLSVYTFKYRTHKDLQIEGIIERSPTPPPLEERDVEDLSPEEMRELLRRQRARAQDGTVKQEGQRPKRERSATIISDDDDRSDSDGDDVEITGENSRRKRARAGSEVSVIDLSSD